VLFFELFPAVFAVMALIVGIVLFAINHRARHNPDEQELPRTPSQPPVSRDATAAASGSRRPSMRA